MRELFSAGVSPERSVEAGGHDLHLPSAVTPELSVAEDYGELLLDET